MRLNDIRLIQFRCHQDTIFTFPSTGNLLLSGKNGSGKTSILEAIYLLSRCRSFRTNSLREIPTWGTGGFSLNGRFSGGVSNELKFTWKSSKRTLGLDGIDNVPLKEYWGRFPTVLFRMSDRSLAEGSPSHRRKWLDIFISSLDKSYLESLQKAQQTLFQKNALLKQPKPDFHLWNILTDSLTSLSQKISAARKKMIADMSESAMHFYRTLADTSDELSFVENYSCDHTKNAQEMFKKECLYQQSLFGYQLDEWFMALNGKPLRNFGSEGQQRSAAIALKFVEAKFLRDLEPKPLLLMDDILHELDPGRRERFWDVSPDDCPCILACTQPSIIEGNSGWTSRELS